MLGIILTIVHALCLILSMYLYYLHRFLEMSTANLNEFNLHGCDVHTFCIMPVLKGVAPYCVLQTLKCYTAPTPLFAQVMCKKVKILRKWQNMTYIPKTDYFITFS